MLKSIEVVNLNHRLTGVYNFHSDLNILTGKNGSGKTTLLKLIWYLVSGNYAKIFDEMYFDYVKVELQREASIQIIIKTDDSGIKKTIITLRSLKNNVDITQESVFPAVETPMLYYAEEPSLFFPTFRRFEGGFQLNKSDLSRFKRNILSDALTEISEELSHAGHKLIATVSTDDLNYLISNKYGDISEEVRKLEYEQSNQILRIVEQSKEREKESLAEIREIVNINRVKKDQLLSSFYTLSKIVDKIFIDKAVKISNNVELGNSKNAVVSDKLSAGEKQMLSFVCYNFFYDNTMVFIDEPELSLNVDWQRLLFPTLLRQKKNNQFIVATHSPFIYSKYPEKEIVIGEDKG